MIAVVPSPLSSSWPSGGSEMVLNKNLWIKPFYLLHVVTETSLKIKNLKVILVCDSQLTLINGIPWELPWDPVPWNPWRQTYETPDGRAHLILSTLHFAPGRGYHADVTSNVTIKFDICSSLPVLLHISRSDPQNDWLQQHSVQEQSDWLQQCLVQKQSSLLQKRLVREQSDSLWQCLVQEQSDSLWQCLVQEQSDMLHQCLVQEQSDSLHQCLVQEQSHSLHQRLILDQSDSLHQCLVQEQSDWLPQYLEQEQSDLLRNSAWYRNKVTAVSFPHAPPHCSQETSRGGGFDLTHEATPQKSWCVPLCHLWLWHVARLLGPLWMNCLQQWRTLVRYHFGSPFSSKRLWFVDTVLWLCPSLPTETLKWISSLPILMQESFWWWQCSDRYIISLIPHLHTPLSLPSLISLMVSVDVKHHVYLLTYNGGDGCN